ncbi:3-oxoadipyl-CoA thiolase [Candidatus Uabimicrobium amorphum]|uniref:Acetyl-CoA acetyltransferase n=1 Tax=Uabimicrobium amorphum TaxID=2596890 RepID=A0A5S9F2K3_UABAM|nr:3-oxoadipyl-CoA thiolase [Candidatus Uabimicrobium amorphum]BBM83767.1 acetyl-CoA acetyltransferase [Candidatus Uabimicrobium amorphum]
MSQAYIVDAIRTPIGKYCGSLSTIRVDDLAALTIKELMQRNKSVPLDVVDDVIFGCANQAGEDNRNIARMALLLAGLPVTVPGETVNRLCASGLSSVVHASQAIRLKEAHIMIAGGAEHMTRAPFVLAKSSTAFSRQSEMYDTSIGWRFPNPKLEALYGVEGMGKTAENLAEKYAISREDQDKFAYNSQMKATKALQSGRLKQEVISVSIPQRKADPIIFEHDEFIKPHTTLEKLNKLRPAFRKDGNGSVTAGNASGINDGSCSILLASEEALEKYSLTPKARFIASAAVGVEPSYMGIGPVTAVQKVLQKSGLSLEQIDVIELNEAFAVQSIACLRELGLQDDDPRVNPNGGAIAIGHPLGMSGSRLVQTAMLELQQTQKKYALCTMCVGVGQGMAAIIERV